MGTAATVPRRPDGHHKSTLGKRKSHVRIKRSSGPKHGFPWSTPCPPPGNTTAQCPGYRTDH